MSSSGRRSCAHRASTSADISARMCCGDSSWRACTASRRSPSTWKSLQPHDDVVEDVTAHLGAALGVEVDQVAPGVAARLEVGAEQGEVVPARAEVVVDHVEDHGQIAGVAGVDEALQAVRAAVRLVHGVPGDAVVAPVPDPVHPVHRQDLDMRDAEVDEVVQPLDRGVERAVRSEGADVQLVEHRAGQVAPRPVGVLPPVVQVVVEPRHPVDPVRLPARPGVGQDRLPVVDEEAVGRAGFEIAGLAGPPAAGAGSELEGDGAVPREDGASPHPFRQRRPHAQNRHGVARTMIAMGPSLPLPRGVGAPRSGSGARGVRT